MTSPSAHSDKWIKCIATHGNLRGVAIQATGLVASIAERHGQSGEVVRGLGEAIIAGLLLGSYCKQGDRVNLNIRGTGRYQQALVDAYPDGSVRGYIIERNSTTKTHFGEDPKQGPWGSGLMSVLKTKDNEGSKPYIGTVPLVTGHLAKDLTFYWFQSEQVPSAVGLAVNMDGDRVSAAGGFLVQALPGASANEVQTIEQHIHELQSLADQLAENADPLHIMSRIFQSTAFIVVEDKPIRFSCNCSWERVRRALYLVGVEELQSMLEEDNHAVVKCDFCSKEYKVDGAELEKMIERAT